MGKFKRQKERLLASKQFECRFISIIPLELVFFKLNKKKMNYNDPIPPQTFLGEETNKQTNKPPNKQLSGFEFPSIFVDSHSLAG